MVKGIIGGVDGLTGFGGVGDLGISERGEREVEGVGEVSNGEGEEEL